MFSLCPTFYFFEVLLIHKLILVSSMQPSGSVVICMIKPPPPLVQLVSVNIRESFVSSQLFISETFVPSENWKNNVANIRIYIFYPDTPFVNFAIYSLCVCIHVSCLSPFKVKLQTVWSKQIVSITSSIFWPYLNFPCLFFSYLCMGFCVYVLIQSPFRVPALHLFMSLNPEKLLLLCVFPWSYCSEPLQ